MDGMTRLLTSGARPLRWWLVAVLLLMAPVCRAQSDWDDLSRRAQASAEEFFLLVDAGDIDGALASMAPELVGDAGSRDAWRKQLEAIRSIHVLALDPFDPAGWSGDRQRFRVVLEAYVANVAADAPVPFYGWHDNPNVRWVTMQQDTGGRWLVRELATGP